MRWLINYIRSCFCPHNFKEYKGQFYKNYNKLGKAYLTNHCTYICTKCGYKKSFWIGE